MDRRPALTVVVPHFRGATYLPESVTSIPGRRIGTCGSWSRTITRRMTTQSPC
ncbi:hypothetical protein JD77_04775 [Micromonospora olivasterospora]|uniref:Uncharacterized protein n=1 Tax=Micromonospora olivasterospora TaxID=1880 RepID=A0A562IFG3_MICOL|nr:hypothetical protein JD77_04775 [Micromonospora olivasterospora]